MSDILKTQPKKHARNNDKRLLKKHGETTVQWFRNPANQWIGSLSHYFQVLYIPGGCLGFLPSTGFQYLNYNWLVVSTPLNILVT